MNISRLIEADLRVLALEAGKKHSTYKQTVDRLMSEIRQTQILPVDKIFAALEETQNLKVVKLHLAAISVL